MRYLSMHINSIPLAARISVPLAAAALLAAGCSSSNSTPSTSGGGSASSGGGSTSGSVTVTTHTGPDGTYLTDSSGRTLYLFMADTSGTSNCSGNCAAVWPPLTGTPTAGSGVTASNLGTITRSDGMKQVTYSGHPLYYYAQDTSPGQASGEGNPGFGAPWYIVSPAGSAITGSGGSGTPAPSGSSSSKAGGWA